MSTPTAVTTWTTQTRHVPYLTNEQYKLAPTAVPWDSLVPGGEPQENETELTGLIAKASRWVDSICMQVLAATIDTEQGVVYRNNRGQIIVHPRYQPVLELTDFWSGAVVQSMAQMSDLSGCWVEQKRIIVSGGGAPVFSSAGPIQFGGFGGSGGPLFCRWTYGNGFPVTRLAAPATQGAMSITVASSVGVLANFTPLEIRDAFGEPVVVTGVASNVLSLGSPLGNPHQAGAAVSNLPQDVEESVILAVSAFSKARGNAAIIAASTGPVKSGMDPLGSGSDFAEAEAILVRGDYLRELS
jgi:hypothetical protein